MNNKLFNILSNAIQNSEYYRDISRISIPDINEFPILTKYDVKKFEKEMLIDQYRYGDIGQLSSVFTSGSTGINTRIFWNYDDYNASNMNIWRLRHKWYDITPASKMVVFSSRIFDGHNISKPPKITYKQKNTILALSKFYLEDNDILEYFDEIKKFQPDWMSIQPSCFVRLIDIIKKYNVYPFDSLKYIELNGEMSTQDTLSYFRESVSIPISNMYGAMETNSIGYECPYHVMHVLENNVFVENIPLENQSTKFLVTSLYNKAMPIIRYDIGDEVYIENNYHCKCGLNSIIIKNIHGRSTDCIITDDNKYISPYTIIYCIEKTNNILHNSILQFKIIQLGTDNLKIILKIDRDFDKWKRVIHDELLKNISNDIYLQNFSISIEFIDHFLDNKDSKFKIFESKIKEFKT